MHVSRAPGKANAVRKEALIGGQVSVTELVPFELAPTTCLLSKSSHPRIELRELIVIRQPQRADDPPAGVAVYSALVAASEHAPNTIGPHLIRIRPPVSLVGGLPSCRGQEVHLCPEIRRTAEQNGGKPLGRLPFAAETDDFASTDWSGRYWARWNDALHEAGFPPNILQARYDDNQPLLDALISEIQRRGKMPTAAELKLRRREDRDFPSSKVFDRLGPKVIWAPKVAARCRDRGDCADVLAAIEPLLAEVGPNDREETSDAGESAIRLRLSRQVRALLQDRPHDFDWSSYI